MRNFKVMSAIVFIYMMGVFGQQQLFAQNNVTGYNLIYAGVGQSLVQSTKYFTLNYEKSGTEKLKTGYQLQAIFYNPYKISQGNYWYLQGVIVTAGAYKKLSVMNGRNFNANVSAGFNVGTDNKRMIFYPSASAEQGFWIAPKLQFVASENVIFMYSGIYKQRWQPFLSLGFKFSM